MACWSAENATRAYLRTLKMGTRGKEPDVSEFISALAAGNNAQLMVMATASSSESTILALVAAAQQTGGRVICILHGSNKLNASNKSLQLYEDRVEFVIGDAQSLLNNEYKGADFVLVDCEMKDHKDVILAARRGHVNNRKGALVVGYNAVKCGPWLNNGNLKAHFLPIGEGLMVIKMSQGKVFGGNCNAKKSHWVVEVDKCTGEEHVYRITSPHSKEIQA